MFTVYTLNVISIHSYLSDQHVIHVAHVMTVAGHVWAIKFVIVHDIDLIYI